MAAITFNTAHRKLLAENSFKPFSPLSAKRSMPLSATGCGGLQRRPDTFGRGCRRARRRRR